MLKILLSIAMLFSGYTVSNVSKVDKIQYSSNDYDGRFLKIHIDMICSKRDIIELKIRFYNKDNREMNNFYSSSLTIEGRKNTEAKVPVCVNEDMHININLYSFNMNEDIMNVTLPVYSFSMQTCNLSEEMFCKSIKPSIVVYQQGNVIEKYEEISLTNKQLKIYSYNNLLPISKINLMTNLYIVDGYATLIIKDKIENLNIYYSDEYEIPINILYDKGIVNFSLANNYHLDRINGITYEEFKENTIYSNNIVFPYENNSYSMSLEITDGFVSFNKVIINFEVYTEGLFLGKCSDSKYCFRRIYI